MKGLPIPRRITEKTYHLFVRHVLMERLHLSPREIDEMPYGEVAAHHAIIMGADKEQNRALSKIQNGT